MDQKRLDRAVHALKSGDFDKALQRFNTLLEEYANDPDLYGYRGTVLLNLKKKKAALRDFDRAVELDASYSYRYASRAFAKDALGDLAGAIADYEKAVELDPDDAIAHNNLGLLIEKSGNRAAAKEHFQTADELAGAFLGDDKAGSGPAPASDIKLEPRKLTPDPKKVSRQMYWSELTRIFSSRTEFSKFMRFVMGGFKSKYD